MLEKSKFHRGRQKFLIGKLKGEVNVKDIYDYLAKKSFTDVILAWKDEGEVLSMRKTNKKIFQYHIRIFDDGEIRCHYEYSSEGSPWKHIFEKEFKAEEAYFKSLLGDYLV